MPHVDVQASMAKIPRSDSGLIESCCLGASVRMAGQEGMASQPDVASRLP